MGGNSLITKWASSYRSTGLAALVSNLEAAVAHSTLETSKCDDVSKIIEIYLKYARGARGFITTRLLHSYMN